jgi:acyl-CoA hydrolase
MPEEQASEDLHVTEADVTMVAVDDQFKPTPILRKP